MATTKINNFYRGDTVSYAMTFTTNSVAMDITGATIWFTLKKSRNDTDAQAVLQKELTSHSDPTHGITTMSLTSTDTNIPWAGDTIDGSASQTVNQWENMTVQCIAANTWVIL